MELEITNLKVRLPSCFAKEYGLHVDDYVMLRDPNKNMFEVKVHKKNDKVYFRDGWIGFNWPWCMGQHYLCRIKPYAYDHKRQIRSGSGLS